MWLTFKATNKGYPQKDTPQCTQKQIQVLQLRTKAAWMAPASCCAHGQAAKRPSGRAWRSSAPRFVPDLPKARVTSNAAPLQKMHYVFNVLHVFCLQDSPQGNPLVPSKPNPNGGFPVGFPLKPLNIGYPQNIHPNWSPRCLKTTPRAVGRKGQRKPHPGLGVRLLSVLGFCRRGRELDVTWQGANTVKPLKTGWLRASSKSAARRLLSNS